MKIIINLFVWLVAFLALFMLGILADIVARAFWNQGSSYGLEVSIAIWAIYVVIVGYTLAYLIEKRSKP